MYSTINDNSTPKSLIDMKCINSRHKILYGNLWSHLCCSYHIFDFSILTSESVKDPCPSRYEHNPFSNTCVRLIETQKDWRSAKAIVKVLEKPC
ncbi:hypothetical protein EB796_013145 [Bugula neritina]|uniref:Uncharacterized protein n=1 Tax=Bugula neritina TaxID=10212 RepID=A0A7J7JRH6_BUGNE|nr:hypothetical protein EB796_013145 [Bugula neritina]